MNLTATGFKKLNYNKVYQAIYNNPDISRQEIIPHTQLSLPTVVQNINELQKNKLIKEEGLAKSTGGRPSIVYRINEVARVSVGVELLPAGVTLAIVDLYGNIQRENSLDKTFVNSSQYFEAVSAWINSENLYLHQGNFLDSWDNLRHPRHHFLGQDPHHLLRNPAYPRLLTQ